MGSCISTKYEETGEKYLTICGHVNCIIYFSSYLPLSLSLRFFAGGGREVRPYVGYVGWLLNSLPWERV